jgi:hypothetical protein
MNNQMDDLVLGKSYIVWDAYHRQVIKGYYAGPCDAYINAFCVDWGRDEITRGAFFTKIKGTEPRNGMRVPIDGMVILAEVDKLPIRHLVPPRT